MAIAITTATPTHFHVMWFLNGLRLCSPLAALSHNYRYQILWRQPRSFALRRFALQRLARQEHNHAFGCALNPSIVKPVGWRVASQTRAQNAA